MAKGGLLSGIGGGAGPTRPVPRPTAPQQPAAGRGGFPPIFSRGVGGILPERGSQMQADMVTGLVQAAMQAAPNSGSPLLAALAPMLGGAALSRANGLREIGQQREQDGMASTLFGRPMSDSERQLMGIMGNEDVPAFYRSEAERRLRAAMTGTGGTGGGSGRTGAPTAGPGGAPAGTPTPDDMTLLLEATDGGRLMTEDQRRTLFTILRDPNSTSQSRQLAQRLLEQHDRNIREGAENPEGLPAGPSVPTDTPQPPIVPSAAPAAPQPPTPWWSPGSSGSTPDIPPPPPGTVPF